MSISNLFVKIDHDISILNQSTQTLGLDQKISINETITILNQFESKTRNVYQNLQNLHIQKRGYENVCLGVISAIISFSGLAIWGTRLSSFGIPIMFFGAAGFASFWFTHLRYRNNLKFEIRSKKIFFHYAIMYC